MDETILIGNDDVGEKGIRCSRKTVETYPAHKHTHYELTLYNPFHGQVIINGEPFLVRTATAVLMTPYYTHRIEKKSQVPAVCMQIAFNGNLFEDNGILPELPLALANIEDGFFRTAFLEIFNRQDDITIVKSILTTILTIMKRDGESLLNERGEKPSSYVTTVTNYINEHYCENINLKKIANMVGVSSNYLCTIFKAEMKIGLAEYLNRSRLLHAEELLKNTNMTATEICYACGYNNFSHFLRNFKRSYGLSPTEYRKA